MSSIPVPESMLLDECVAAKDYAALNEPFFEGLRVGRLGLPCLNEYGEGIGQAEFRRGWQQGTNEHAKACIERNARAILLAADLRQRAKRCVYTDRECDCARTGRCLDTV